MQYEVEAIIGKRYTQSDKTPQYLVKWKNYPIEQSSWEPPKNLHNSQQFIQLYQNQHSLPKPISLLPAHSQPNSNNHNALSFESSEEEATTKLNKYKERNKKLTKLEKCKIGEKSERESGKLETRKKGGVGSKVRIIERIVKGGRAYFKVVEEGRKVWRNRNYLLEFYPKQVCDFYEYLILQRYQ